MERICTSFFEKTNKQKMLLVKDSQKNFAFFEMGNVLINSNRVKCLKNVTYGMWCVCVSE